MSEQDRQRAIRLRLMRSEARGVARLPTGFETLDRALDGGLPRGRITEVLGEPAAGKTTLALSVAACAQRNGLAAAWIDAERAFDPVYASRLGVHLDALPVVRADTAEESLEIARRLTASGAIGLLALDSAAALVPALELEIGLGEAGLGLQGRILASGFRRLALVAFQTETTIIVLNQLRSVGAEAGESSAGGPGVKLHSTLRIALEALETGSGARFRILKSRFTAPVREGEFHWDGANLPAETP
jgi:recombination protein RecA